MPAAKTLDAYVRVSQTRGRTGASFISPDVQRESIERWVDSQKDVELGEVFTDLDVSGGKMDRPELELALARIKDLACPSQGLIVAKLDRFGRTMDAARVIKEIEAAEGELISVAENFDTRTPAGKFARTMMLAIAEMQLEQIREGWLAARAQAIERGVFVGAAPLGYDRPVIGTKKDGSPEYGPLVKNADAGLVRRAFYISAGRAEMGTDDEEGAGNLHAALAYLAETFPEGRSGARHWSVDDAQRLLANRLYVGEMRSGEIVETFPELAIVPPMIFELAQHDDRPISRRSKLLGDFPLTHIARCGCGAGLVAKITKSRDGTLVRRMRCITCSAPTNCTAEPLERIVLDAVRASPPTLNTNEMIRRRASLFAVMHELEEHLAERDEIKPKYVPAWEAMRADLEAELIESRQAADSRQFAELPDLADPSPADLRVIFERAVQSLIVRKGRGPLAERVSLELRA